MSKIVLDVSNVTKAYPNRVAVNNVSFNIHEGEIFGFLGPNGAGKTTLVNLLMKFYDIDDGDIIIDGKSIKTLTRKNVHDLFTMVLQDTWLFKGTVRENLCYNCENISDDKIMEVCRIIG